MYVFPAIMTGCRFFAECNNDRRRGYSKFHSIMIMLCVFFRLGVVRG